MKYITKPCIIEAIQWTGDNYDELRSFAGNDLFPSPTDPKFKSLKIVTLEGIMTASIGDYIIKGLNGELYPCKEDIFKKKYVKPTENLSFANALELAINGSRITREGWNGKGMFVVYQKAYPDGIPCNKQTAEAWGIEEGSLFRCEPYLQIKTADNTHAMWVPSIRDILANDWRVVE